ncbi:phosphoadenosine phosphosulfate reductase family protein [Eubacterium callanderi]|nr:phosphoadenosine phosphosulfate reductase family protein [Eubacterium callanderi]MBV1685223.1 phosphoadenosine phosphosulfate reductase family protein [Eubacterium callanderi]
MQAWPLERKVRVSQLRIMEWYQYWHGQVCVSFSGGKDSTVLLDLARHIYPDIPAIFVDTGLEYPEIRRFALSQDNVFRLKPKLRFDEVIEKYGYPVISKRVAGAVEDAKRNLPLGKITTGIQQLMGTYQEGRSWFNFPKWYFLIDAPFKISDRCCDVMKKAPIKAFQHKHGFQPMVGTLAEEGMQRKVNWYQYGCNIFDSKNPVSRPLSFWRNQDILAYLKQTGLPFSSVYGAIVEEAQMTMPFMERKLRTTKCDRTGCIYCMFGIHLDQRPNRFERLRYTHPKQYQYCVEQLGCGKVLDFLEIPY